MEQSERDQAGVFCSGSLQPQHQGRGRAMPSSCALLSCLVPTQHQEERRSVKHILFSAWPDHQTPESAGPLLRLVAEVEDSPETAANTGPIVVHCRYVPPPPKPFLPAGPLLGRSLSRAGPGLTWTGNSRSFSKCSVLPSGCTTWTCGLDTQAQSREAAPSLLRQETNMIPAVRKRIYSLMNVY